MTGVANTSDGTARVTNFLASSPNLETAVQGVDAGVGPSAWSMRAPIPND
jgi:hypothetical protein